MVAVTPPSERELSADALADAPPVDTTPTDTLHAADMPTPASLGVEVPADTPIEDDIVVLPDPDDVPDQIIRKLRSFPRKRVLQFDIIWLQSDIPDDAIPQRTAVIFPVDKETGSFLDVWYNAESPIDPNELLKPLIHVLLKFHYYPKKIEVRTADVEALLRNFCQKANIQLRRIKTLPELDRVYEKFYDNTSILRFDNRTAPRWHLSSLQFLHKSNLPSDEMRRRRKTPCQRNPVPAL